MNNDRDREHQPAGDDPGLAYWLNRLDGVPALELVTDRGRSAVRSAAEASLSVTLDCDVTKRLTDLCHEYRVSRFMALMALFQLLIGRYAAVRDVAVGTPVAVGQEPEFEGLAGSTRNTVVIRTSWEDEPSFATLLDRVRDAVLGARAHKDVPIERIAAARQAPDGPGGEPPCRISLGMSDAPLGALDLAVTWRRVDSGQLLGVVRYNPELFDRATVERMMSHHAALLESALATPQIRVSELEHTTPDERALLAAWGVEESTGRPHSLLDGFRRQAGVAPDAVALVFDDATLTYAELRRRSERLAGALVRRGVGPETVVGLAMDRSAALVVAMLAVVTAGAAYLPLDPEYPDSRLAFMVADSDACLVLADRELPWAQGVPVLRMAEVTADAAAEPRPWVDRPAHPDQRACVLYTSGSTGRPKGVATTHRGIVRLVCEAAFFACDRSDVVAQTSSPSFDAASLEIWGALLNGARLCGIPKDEVLSNELLAARVKAHGITAMFLATSVFHMHADVAPGAFTPLRALYFGGEPADARRVAAVRAVAPGLRLVNGYGPTECTTFASTFSVGDVGPDVSTLPIGHPIPETSLHVLDGMGRETGIGIPGELYIGGSGLARGYLGRPDLTAERFVPSPFRGGERLYRTGDIARWREGGLLECLGRVDTQVKIRGVRIELEEIASVLGTHPHVRAAVVGARSVGDAKRLVAYVVPQQGRPVEPRELRAYLGAQLPEAMVPTWYVPLAGLPLTPNGKVDRRALPAPAEEDGVHAAVHVPPQGATERVIAKVWAEVLDVSSVSATDDFLALGGNSLLATRVVAQLGTRLGLKVGVRDLFEAPTVAALAARVLAARRADTDPPLVATGDGPQPPSFAQQRMWFLDQLAPGSPLYTVPLVLSVDGPLDVPALAASLQALVQRHPSLRTLLVAGDDGPRQVIVPDMVVPLEFDDLLQLPAGSRQTEADLRMEHEVRRPFELASGPLIRARLLRLAEERFELLLTMHHAVCDGWSVGILVDDLASFYASAAAGATEPGLQPLAIRYADYAVWQRRLLDGGVRDVQLAYWGKQLHDAPPALELPTDRARPPVPRYVGNALPLRLSPDLTKRLTDTSRTLGVTPFTMLVAVFQLLMGRYARVRDVSVGTPVSGRTRPEFERLLGCFINTLVIRTQWTDDLTFAEFLTRVRESTLGAYDHQDVPFEDVVELLNPPRVPGRTPLIQVMVAMQNISAGTSRFPGLSVSIRQLSNRLAKFDLILSWAEFPGASGELSGFAEYDVDLFDRETVERMMRHYVRLLEAALAAPAAPLSSLPSLGDEERDKERGAAGGGLPPPAGSGSGSAPVFAGEIEAAVAAVWREVLRLASVEVDDNFFEVGGTSLLILQLQTGLVKALGLRVPVVELFRHPTIRTLARHLASSGDSAATEGAVGRRRAAARNNFRGMRGRPADQASTEPGEAGE
jgi:surfactin family lipopeptide synthetase A